MSGKFMKVIKVVIPTLVVLVIASQLVGAVACSQSEMLEMINNQQAIEIEIAEPINQEQGTERELEWLELAFLQTYPEFRDIFDDAIGVTAHGQNGKNGIIYVDLTGKHTNNSTLYYAFMNNKFLTKCWNNTDTMKKLTDAVKNVYADVETDAIAKIALLNAYFNVFPDAEPNYFNGSSTLTRGEFLAGVYRASNPVSDIEINGALASIVDPTNTDETVIFSSQMLDYSYLNLDDKSLHHNTYNTTISRAEAIYTIVQMFYADEYKATTGKESCYSDAKNGGDIASKQLFIEKNKETGEMNYKDYWKSYELSYSIQNPTKGLPDDLYKALVVAKNHNLISGSESRWDEGLTKGECLNLLVRVYESKGTITNADRGASTGEVINPGGNTDVQTPSTGGEHTPGNSDHNGGGGEATGNGSEAILFDAQAFDPANLIYHADTNTLEIKRILIDGILELEQFKKYGADEIEIFIGKKYFDDFSFRKTASDLYEAINRYNDTALIDYIIYGPKQSENTQIPVGGTDNNDTTQTPVEYTYTEINVRKLAQARIDVYADASGSSQKVGEIQTGYIVTIVKQCNETGWYEISANKVVDGAWYFENDIVGFIHPDTYQYLMNRADKEAQNPLSKYTFNEFNTRMQATSEVNVRDLPSTDGTKLDKLKADQIVIVTGQCNETGWYRVTYFSKNLNKAIEGGYVSSNYLKEYTESETPSGGGTTQTPDQGGNNGGGNTQTPTGGDNTTETPSGNTGGGGGTTQKPTNNYTEYAPTGEVFTETVTINGQPITVTGTTKIYGNLIVSGLKADDKILIEGGSNLTYGQLYKIEAAYDAIYDRVGKDFGADGTVTFIINSTGGQIGTGDIQINK